jgi:hypothetical protein
MIGSNIVGDVYLFLPLKCNDIIFLCKLEVDPLNMWVFSFYSNKYFSCPKKMFQPGSMKFRSLGRSMVVQNVVF